MARDGAEPMRASSASPAALQARLQAIYGVEAPGVDAFLLAPEAAVALGHRRRAPEELLVVEEGGDLLVGLCLDEVVTAGAARGRLGRLAELAEGVSHFVYLCTRAAAGRPVSLLELEVQAEVDKFAVLLLARWRHDRRRRSRALRRRLFEAVGYRADLGAEALHRYREANRLGGGYARWLEGRFVASDDLEGLLRELRASYRMGGGEKYGHLMARAH